MDFLKRIDFKQVLIHCLAGIFLTFAVSLLGYINDIELIRFVEEKGIKEALNIFEPERLSYYIIWFGLYSLIGLLLSTIISAIFFFKKKLFWLHSVIVFTVLFVSNYYGFFRNHKPYIAHLMSFDLVINVIISSSILMILAIIAYYYSYRISIKYK